MGLPNHSEAEEPPLLVTEVPSGGPDLSPGLARALLRVIRGGARDQVEAPDEDRAARLAS